MTRIITLGIALGIAGGLVIPAWILASSVYSALHPRPTALAPYGIPTRPSANHFWEPIQFGNGLAAWVERPSGWVDPIYPPIGLAPSNTW